MHKPTAYYGQQNEKTTFIGRLETAIAANLLQPGHPPVMALPVQSDDTVCVVSAMVGSYSHALYATELGVPYWVSSLHEFVFEQVHPDRANMVAVAVAQAIVPGTTESAFNRILERFMATQLVDPVYGLAVFGPFDTQVHAAIKNTGLLFLHAAAGQLVYTDKWQKAFDQVSTCPAPPESAACNVLSALSMMIKVQLSHSAEDMSAALHLLHKLHPGKADTSAPLHQLHPGKTEGHMHALWMAETISRLFAKGATATTVAGPRQLALA